MNELLAKYKSLVDFEDKMQKSNMKFVDSYLSFHRRKNRDGWEQDCIEFLKGAISCQESLLANIRDFQIKYKEGA